MFQNRNKKRLSTSKEPLFSFKKKHSRAFSKKQLKQLKQQELRRKDWKIELVEIEEEEHGEW